jgi:high mobility group protein B2
LNFFLTLFSHLVQARILARRFKELPEKETRKWEKKAEQDKIRYQEEMKHYVPAEDPTAETGGRGKKKAKRVRSPNDST